MKSPEEIAELRKKIIEHLEQAMLLAEDFGDGAINYMLSVAIEKIAVAMWPQTRPRHDGTAA